MARREHAGTRLDAEIVLTDADLDVALIRPRDPEEAEAGAFRALAIDEASGTAAVLDQVITLGRLGPHGHRAASVEIQRVRAVLERPRLAYEVGSRIGFAVFDGSGVLIGITILCRICHARNRERGFDPEEILMGGPAAVGFPGH